MRDHRIVRAGWSIALGAAALGILAALAVAAAPGAGAQEGVPSTCPAGGEPVELTSVEQVEELFVGTWIHCDGAAVLANDTVAGDIGVRFTADGRFHTVYEGPDGGLIYAEGLDQEGDWSVRDADTGDYVVELDALAGRFRWGLVEEVASPVVTFNGGSYVAWTGDDPVPGVPAEFADEPCGVPTDPVPLPSAAATVELLAGTWIRCSGSSPVFDTPGGDVGIELVEDGTFHLLFEAADGTLVRGEGERREGTWTVVTDPAYTSVDLALSGASTYPRQAFLFETPPFLRLQRQVSTFYDHVRWTGPPPVDGSAVASTTTVPTTPATTGTAVADDTGVLGRTTTLPRTGTDPLALVAAAAVLTAVGLVAVALVRPR
ncbi:MAG: hypothetical protein S0880_10570 [Actinomycetota bacterium]|nr:hypothetical protein [Actinomycetota bacterium]